MIFFLKNRIFSVACRGELQLVRTLIWVLGKYMKRNFECQDDFDYKKLGALPITVRVMYRIDCLSDKSALSN